MPIRSAGRKHSSAAAFGFDVGLAFDALREQGVQGAGG